MGLKRITYSLPILKSLVNSKTACVFCFENSRKCFNTTPAQLANLKVAVKEHLASKVSTYDPEFQGIIMSHKNIRVVNSVSLSDDGEYRLDYIADIYVFKPSVENILTGVVNKKSQDHLGVLVHSFFNATIPRQRIDTECPKIWPGADVKIGEQVTFEVVRVNFLSRLPYIKGQLVGIKGRDVEDRDSGLDHESTEEWSYRSSPPGVGDSDCSEDVKGPKARKKGRSTDSPSPTHPSKNNHSLLELQSSLISEVMASPPHIPTTPINSLSKSLSDSSAKKNPSKKRKRDSSLLEIENSLLTEAVKCLTSPEVFNDGNQPKVKKKRTSTTLPCANETFSGSETLETPQSTMQKLINSEISSLKPKKKKSSLFPSEDISRDAKMSNSVETLKSHNDNSFSLGKHSIKDKESNKHEQSIYFERDTSLAEEACTFQQKIVSLNDPSSNKKCKKKKRESSCIEDLKNDVLTESDDVKIDTRERHKKKKRSMTFQDSAESSTLVNGLDQPHKFRNKPSVLAPELDNLIEAKKKKKSTKHISFEDLNGSFANVNLPGVPSEHSSYCYDTEQLNNLSEQKEEDSSLQVNKKKKKRSSAVVEDTESSILDRDYSKNEFLSTSTSEKLVTLTGGNEPDKSLSDTNNDSFQQHKKKKKKKSLLSHNADVSSSVVNDISEDSHLEIRGLENENFLNVKESKKKKKNKK